MSPYEKSSVNKMLRQVNDMKNTKKDVWHESFFETDLRLDVNKKPEEC